MSVETINAQDYIDEIVDNISKKDQIKADIVMSYIAGMDRGVQEKMLFELSKVNNSFTISYIIHLLEIVNTLKISAEDIQYTLQDMLLEQPENLTYLFEHPAIADKINLLDMAGELQFEGAIPYLLEMLNSSTDNKKIIDILKTLGAIGSPRTISSISEYLYSEERSLILAAIDALKEIGTPEAVKALGSRMGTDHEIDEKTIDIFASIRDEESLEQLNKVMKNGDPYLRNHAKMRLIRIGQKVVPIVIKNLEDSDSEFVIHSLNVLGVIGDSTAVNAIKQLLFNEPENANIRFAAYEALGLLPTHKGVFVLSNGLVDPVDQVRNAAARAIEKNNNNILRSGIKNLIRSEDDEAKRIVSAFIDAESDSIFRSMIAEQPFQKMAIQYLKEEAHPDLKEHYCSLLRQLGYAQFAEEIKPSANNDSGRLKIYVVDDSRMLLKVYKSNLHAIGYTSRLFEFPESALEQIMEEKPDLLITDLNMPKITGLQLTKKVREKYSKEELPIILITTQTDRDETKEAYAAGINDVIYKPFKKEELKAKIQELT